MNKKAKPIRLMEVGPRDGLQSENKALSLSQRQRLIEDLEAAGIEDIEVGSFVRDNWIPQLAGTDQLMKRLRQSKRKARLWAFVPNIKGLDKASECEVDGVGFFYAVSDRFCRKNVNRSKKDVLTELKTLCAEAWSRKIKFRIYLSTSFHCPYMGFMKPSDFQRSVEELLNIGAPDVGVSDTTGRADPKMIEQFLGPVIRRNGSGLLSMHLHNTQGMALTNIYVGHQMGVTQFDSSLAGMGGCPYAPGASGNLATEELVQMFQGQDLLTNVSLKKLIPVGRRMERLMGRTLPSSILRSGVLKK